MAFGKADFSMRAITGNITLALMADLRAGKPILLTSKTREHGNRSAQAHQKGGEAKHGTVSTIPQ
jgi:hypothetical protein